jgi:23S rRNA C2498 (ribose-2'-O)-methylase RlmM
MTGMIAQNTLLCTHRDPSQLSILQENGGDDDLRPLMAELQGTIACVGEGDLDVKVSFSNRGDDIGHLGRNFNHMVRQLRESREKVERLHCTQKKIDWREADIDLLKGMVQRGHEIGAHSVTIDIHF